MSFLFAAFVVTRTHLPSPIATIFDVMTRISFSRSFFPTFSIVGKMSSFGGKKIFVLIEIIRISDLCRLNPHLLFLLLNTMVFLHYKLLELIRMRGPFELKRIITCRSHLNCTKTKDCRKNPR